MTNPYRTTFTGREAKDDPPPDHSMAEDDLICGATEQREATNHSAVLPFLTLISKDIDNYPERLSRIDAALTARINELIAGVEIVIDAPLARDGE